MTTSTISYPDAPMPEPTSGRPINPAQRLPVRQVDTGGNPSHTKAVPKSITEGDLSSEEVLCANILRSPNLGVLAGYAMGNGDKVMVRFHSGRSQWSFYSDAVPLSRAYIFDTVQGCIKRFEESADIKLPPIVLHDRSFGFYLANTGKFICNPDEFKPGERFAVTGADGVQKEYEISAIERAFPVGKPSANPYDDPKPSTLFGPYEALSFRKLPPNQEIYKMASQSYDPAQRTEPEVLPVIRRLDSSNIVDVLKGAIGEKQAKIDEAAAALPLAAKAVSTAGSQSQKEAFHERLLQAGICLSSPRAHQAIRDMEPDFSNADAMFDRAVKFESAARQMWLDTALDPWCARHNLTREQALSVLFDDASFNPQDPQKDRVTKETIFGWSGQQNDFAMYLMAQMREKKQADSQAQPAAAPRDRG